MIRKWDKEHPEERKAIQRKYKKTDKGKIASKRERVKNQKQIVARRKINCLITEGYIQRDICAICGKENAEMHHENYDMPYQITWLCRSHHLELHKGDVDE